MRDPSLFDKIDLHLIRVLHTVLTERSVSRAALRLGMYQPAVSAALKRLRVVFADDSFLVREGTSALLAEATDIEVIASVGTGVELLSAVDRHRPVPPPGRRS